MSKFEVGQKWKQRNGTIVTVVFVNATSIVVEQSNGYVFISNLLGRINNAIASDYDLMEQVTEKKYRPFKNAEEYKPYRSIWVKRKSEDAAEFRVAMVDNNGIEFCNYAYDWKSGFERLTFECGTPFGIEVKS